MKLHDPAVRPLAPAVRMQSTYLQSRWLASTTPGPYSPIQSFGVGLLIPLQDTVTLPRPTLLGLALRLADPLGVRVAVLVDGLALAGEAAAVLVDVEVGWGVLPALVAEAWVVVPVVEVAPRVGVVVAWAPTEVDGLLVGVAVPGSTDAAAKGVGDDKQA